jgi:hypothetical protein
VVSIAKIVENGDEDDSPGANGSGGGNGSGVNGSGGGEQPDQD